ncbi:MAG: TIGR00725 family protein [Chloroflexi bacterium RBG_16_48_7]|nr:MAG: TIGR00725 family protein [Chloroflexi bacterium RBG_16_48_7]
MKNKGGEKKLFIAVVGGGKCTPEEAVVAESVGRELAKRGAILVCGGLGGIMEAACKGASSEGGITIGILPSDNADTANPYVQIPIATGMGEARNLVIVRTARAVIAVSGEYGTLSEIAFALKNNKPVIGLNTWSLRKNSEDVEAIIPADNAVDAVDKAIELARFS